MEKLIDFLNPTLNIIFGEDELLHWIGHCFVFLIGVTIEYFIRTSNRKHKWVSFDLKYFILDNYKKFILILLLMYVFIRGYSEFEPYFKDYAIFKYELSRSIGLIFLGVFNQKIIEFASNKLKLKGKLDPIEYQINKQKNDFKSKEN